jgi:hypothetical protein
MLHLLRRLKNMIGAPLDGDSDAWGESPEGANTAVLLGAPDIDVELVELLEREFPREHVAKWVRIRWSLRTVDDLCRRIKKDEIEEVDWLHEDEKEVLRRLCGIH